MGEFEYGVCEWAVFRNGEIWTDSLISEEDCKTHIKECGGVEGEFTYKLITEEERLSYLREKRVVYL